MKKRVFIIATVACIILILSASIGVNLYNHTPKRLYEINWDITLPKKLHSEFDLSTEPSFHGDGIHYTIFSSKDELPNEFLADFTQKNIEQIQEDICGYLEMIAVPSAYYPDFEHSYSAKTMEMYENKLYLLYDNDTNLLYVVQWMQ